MSRDDVINDDVNDVTTKHETVVIEAVDILPPPSLCNKAVTDSSLTLKIVKFNLWQTIRDDLRTKEIRQNYFNQLNKDKSVVVVKVL